MEWTFVADVGGLVWPDPGEEAPLLKEALRDCVESLSPAGDAPTLSTYWIDRLLERCAEPRRVKSLLAQGNWWTFWLDGDVVRIGDEDQDDLGEALLLTELVAGLKSYRAAVESRIGEGHPLEDRWWAQRNPG